jgi:hypothetical protein
VYGSEEYGAGLSVRGNSSSNLPGLAILGAGKNDIWLRTGNTGNDFGSTRWRIKVDTGDFEAEASQNVTLKGGLFQNSTTYGGVVGKSDDTGSMAMGGGASVNNTDGGVIVVRGNSFTTQADKAGKVEIFAGTGANGDIDFYTHDSSTTKRWSVRNSGEFQGSQTDNFIGTSSVDGADSSSLQLLSYSGTSLNSNRGAGIVVKGNEYSSNAGDLYMEAGNVSGAEVHIAAANATGGIAFLTQGWNTAWKINSSDDTLTFHKTEGTIMASTSPGGESAGLLLNGGGSAGSTRGAHVGLYGADHGSFPGLCYIAAASSGSWNKIILHAGGNDRWSVENTGHLVPASSGNLNIGASGTPVDTVYLEDLIAFNGAGSIGQRLAKTANGVEWETPAAAGTDALVFETTTSGASTSSLGQLEVPDETVITFTAIISARYDTTGSNKSYWAVIEGGVRRNNAGSAALVGTQVVTEDDENSAGYSADVDVSGNNLRIRVTGAAGETVDWRGKLLYVTDSAFAVPAQLVRTYNNNQAIQWEDNAGSSNIDVIKVDTSDDTILNAASGSNVLLQVNDTTVLQASDDYVSIKADTQTTNATQTTLWSATLDDDTTYKFTVDILGRLNSTSAKNIWGTLEFGVRRNNGGSATLIGTRLKTADSEGTPTWDFDVDVNSNDVRIRVTGAASETVRWGAGIRYLSRS